MVARRAHPVRESLLAAFCPSAHTEATGLALSVLASGFPDLVLLLICSALVGLGWAVVKAVWTFTVVRAEQTAAVPAT